MTNAEARKLEKKLAAMKKALDAAFDMLPPEEEDDGDDEEVRTSLHHINSSIEYIRQVLT